MNILIYRYNSICEDAVIRGLKELGHTVYEVILEVENKSPSGQEILDAVVMGMEKSNADIIFSINYYPALSEIARVYKLLYYSWIVDAPVLELYSKTIKNRCNRVFIFDSELYREISVYNPYNIFYLPLASDCDFYQKAIRHASLADVEKYTHNISFVGSLYTEKCPYDKVKNLSPKISGYLHGIMKAQEKIYGYYFVEELLSDELVDEFVKNYDGYYLAGEEDLLTKEIPKLKNHGTIMTHTQMPIVFNKSTINLNPTSKPIRSGIPLRIFDLLACEGFVLCNYQSDLLNEFLPGEELDIYSSIEELEEKIRYYLSHTDVCREIAHNGHEKVSKYHTYPLRLEQMFRLGEHRRR